MTGWRVAGASATLIETQRPSCVPFAAVAAAASAMRSMSSSPDR
jgi:hypothetical protein